MPYKDIEKKRAAKRKCDAAHREKTNENNRKYYAEHRESESAKSKAWREANIEYRQNHRREYLYGINTEEYNRLFELQEGKCAICGKHQSQFEKRLYVDHDHESGRVRGLLCQKCNSAIGLLCDDVSLLKIAVRYLEGAL
jgi:hypothetical protein